MIFPFKRQKAKEEAVSPPVVETKLPDEVDELTTKKALLESRLAQLREDHTKTKMEWLKHRHNLRRQVKMAVSQMGVNGLDEILEEELRKAGYNE